MTLDLSAIRSQFPSSIARHFLSITPWDTNCQTISDRINRYLIECNANHGGACDQCRIR
jgi:hypothetical protein